MKRVKLIFNEIYLYIKLYTLYIIIYYVYINYIYQKCDHYNILPIEKHK